MQQTGDISSSPFDSWFTESTSRTHRILEELRDVGLAGHKVDFLYVDEVQDNLLIDTLGMCHFLLKPPPA